MLKEHILLGKILTVGSDQLSVVGQGSAGSIFYLEVLHSFGNLLESRRVIDLDNGGIEYFVKVSLDLRGLDEVVVCLVLEGLLDGVAGDSALGEVIEEE